jgi:hypothetical protein
MNCSSDFLDDLGEKLRGSANGSANERSGVPGLSRARGVRLPDESQSKP